MPAPIGTIRHYRNEDAEACSLLLRTCLASGPFSPEAARQEIIRAETTAVMHKRAGLFYLAVHEIAGEITGIGGVDMNEIRLLAVHPDHRGSGIGTALLEHLESLVPPGLFRDIIIYAAPEAEGFYLARGYRAGGEVTIRSGNITLPAIFMTKRQQP